MSWTSVARELGDEEMLAIEMSVCGKRSGRRRRSGILWEEQDEQVSLNTFSSSRAAGWEGAARTAAAN
jgi:hypothetical protein